MHYIHFERFLDRFLDKFFERFFDKFFERFFDRFLERFFDSVALDRLGLTETGVGVAVLGVWLTEALLIRDFFCTIWYFPRGFEIFQPSHCYPRHLLGQASGQTLRAEHCITLSRCIHCI
jgi:hypothetical protein